MSDASFTIANLACFRTRITLDSTRFFIDPEASRKSLAQTAKRMMVAFPDLDVVCPGCDDPHGGGYYASLEESSSDVFSSPLWEINGIHIDQAKDKVRDVLIELNEDVPFFVPDRIKLYVYDNTLAMLEWDLVADPQRLEDAQRANPRTLDKVTSFISEILISLVADQLVAWLAEAIGEAHEDADKHDGGSLSSIFKHPRKLNLFFDIDENEFHPGQHYLWTSRTALMSCFPDTDSEDLLAWHRAWTQSDGHLILLADDCKCWVCWGNNTIAGAGCHTQRDVFMSVNRRLQFFYATTNTHSHNITRLLLRGSVASEKSARHIVDKYRLIRTDLYYSESMIFDTLHGLQGNNYKIFTALFEQWRFRQLLQGVQRKVEMADSIIRDRLANKRMAMQRSLKGLLIALSAIEVIGTLVSLVDLAYNNKVTHSDWGILHIIHGWRPDAVITISAGLLAILVILIFLSGLQSEPE